jgi:hypothetical protein
MEHFLSKQLKEGEITWYMELWDNGKRVMTWLPGGHEGGEDTGPKQATPEPSECKHGSEYWMMWEQKLVFILNE